MRNYSFKPGWFASLACLILSLSFAGLGCWQLQRADEKTVLMQMRIERMAAPPLPLSALTVLTGQDRFRRIEVTGLYDVDHPFLLDNQVYRQQAGYHVLLPLSIDNGSRHILINQGWIPAGPKRDTLPTLTKPVAAVTVTGILDHFPQPALKLSGGEIPTPGWPARLLRLEAPALTTRLGYPLSPYQVLLDETQADGYLRDWKPPDLAPEKNRGYALQWFLFALTTVIIYSWHGFKRGRASPSSHQSMPS